MTSRIIVYKRISANYINYLILFDIIIESFVSYLIIKSIRTSGLERMLLQRVSQWKRNSSRYNSALLHFFILLLPSYTSHVLCAAKTTAIFRRNGTLEVALYSLARVANNPSIAIFSVYTGHLGTGSRDSFLHRFLREVIYNEHNISLRKECWLYFE